MLTVTLYGSIHYGERIWEASQSRAANAENVRYAQAQIASIIAAAYPKIVSDDALHSRVDFEGEPHMLRVLAPDALLKGGLARFAIRLEAAGATSALVVQRKLELAPTTMSKGAAEVLLDHVSNLSFQYFGPEKPRAKPEWHDRWTGKMRPPLLVRVRAALSDDRVTWPDLVAAPQIQGDVSCMVDAASGACGGR